MAITISEVNEDEDTDEVAEMRSSCGVERVHKNDH